MNMTKIIDRVKSTSFWVPTTGFLIFLSFYLVLFSLDGNKYYTLDRMLTQWDAQHYFSIADRGYEMFPCSYGGGYICGNIGWFPFYPLISALIAYIIPAVNWVMLIISWLSFYLSLLLIFNLVDRRFSHKAAILTTITILVFPASFYYLSAFPYSLMMLLAVLTFYILERKKYHLLPFLAGPLAVTYPSGILIILPLCFYLIKNRSTLRANDKKWLVGSMAAPVIALLLYGLYYQLQFGDFFLYLKFQAQSYYSHQMNFPLLVIWDSFRNLTLADPVNLSLLYIMVGLIIFYNKKLPAVYQIFMWAILLFTPTLGTTDCYYRHIIVAFPLYIMLGSSFEINWRRYLLPLYLIAGFILNWWIFIPAYRSGQLM